VDGKFFAPLLATEKPAPEEWRTGFLWGTCHPTYQAVRTNGRTYVEWAGGERKLYYLGEATHQLRRRHEMTDLALIADPEVQLEALKGCEATQGRGAQLARNPSGRKDSHDVRLKRP
jgi:hypothetical protein